MFIQVVNNKRTKVININVDRIEYFETEKDFQYKNKENGSVRERIFLSNDWDEREHIEEAIKEYPGTKNLIEDLRIWDLWEKVDCQKVTLYFPTRKLIFKGQEAEDLISSVYRARRYAKS